MMNLKVRDHEGKYNMRETIQGEGISKSAIIHENVIIGKGAIIHDYVIIYPNTEIGENVEIFDHCVIGKPPVTTGATSRKLKSTYGKTKIGNNSVLHTGVVIYAETTIGRYNLIGDFCSIREECSTKDSCILGRNVCINYNVSIGANTKIMDSSIITGNMKIGNDVFISVLVATSNDNSIGKHSYSTDMQGPTIEDDVLIGAGANILPSIHVKSGSIVGAGSVVTKDVEAHTLVMGVPAVAVRALS